MNASRQIKIKFTGGSGNIVSNIKNLYGGFKEHRKAGGMYQFLEGLKVKFPRKVLTLNDKGKKEFLKGY